MSAQRIVSVVKTDTVTSKPTSVTVKSVLAVGLTGSSGVYQGTTPPADTSVIWADTTGL